MLFSGKSVYPETVIKGQKRGQMYMNYYLKFMSCIPKLYYFEI